MLEKHANSTLIQKKKKIAEISSILCNKCLVLLVPLRSEGTYLIFPTVSFQHRGKTDQQSLTIFHSKLYSSVLQNNDYSSSGKKKNHPPSLTLCFYSWTYWQQNLWSIKYSRRHSCPVKMNWDIYLCWKSGEESCFLTQKTASVNKNTVLNADWWCCSLNLSLAQNNSQTSQTNRPVWITTLRSSKSELSFCC